MLLDENNRPWCGKNLAYDVLWLKRQDGCGMRMKDAEKLFLQELRAVHMASERGKEAKPIKVAAIIFVDNNASILVAEKLGYVKESTSKVPGMPKTVHTYCKTLVCI